STAAAARPCGDRPGSGAPRRRRASPAAGETWSRCGDAAREERCRRSPRARPRCPRRAAGRRIARPPAATARADCTGRRGYRACTLFSYRGVAAEPAREPFAQHFQEVSPEVEKDPLPHHLPGCGGDFGFHRGEKLGEHRLGSPVDHSLADGGQRAADLGIALVLENRLGARFLEIERAGSFDEALLALAVDNDAVVLGRLQVLELDLAFVQSLDRRDADVDLAGVFVLADLLELVAAGDALRQALRVDEKFPNPLA